MAKASAFVQKLSSRKWCGQPENRRSLERPISEEGRDAIAHAEVTVSSGRVPSESGDHESERRRARDRRRRQNAVAAQ
jgi:hypothetical protein